MKNKITVRLNVHLFTYANIKNESIQKFMDKCDLHKSKYVLDGNTTYLKQ